MRLLVCGGRHFLDAKAVVCELDEIHAARPIAVVIHGGLPVIGGAAEKWARKNKTSIVRYPANWLLGKGAELTRNRFMLLDSRPDLLLAFPGHKNLGALVGMARTLSIPVVSSLQSGSLEGVRRGNDGVSGEIATVPSL